ncbi:MAG: hypothetical protein H7222_03975 [Methylotenera sp.]|nr:hypothetical protein [Oligoflexia bacterium]
MKSSSLIVLFIASLTAGPQNLAYSQTRDRSTGPRSADNYSSIQAAAPEAPSCENLCDKFVKNIEGNQVFYGLDGINHNNNWGPSDDKWCGQHGIATDSSVQPAVPYTATAEDIKDKVNYNRKMDQCGYHNSELALKCQAYTLIQTARKFNTVLACIDTAAAATCLTECAMDNSTLGTAALAHTVTSFCKVSGAAAGVLEVANLATMDEMSGGKRLLAGAAAAAGGAVAVGAVAVNGAGALSPCISAVLFGVLAGVRFGNANDNRAKDAACASIQTLWSQSSSANPNGDAGHGNGGQFGGGNQTGLAAGSRNGGYSSSTGPGGSTAQYENGLRQALASTDGGALLNTPLGKRAVELAPTVDSDKIMKDISSGLSPGQAVTNALGAASPESASLLAKIDGATKEYMSRHGVEGSSYAGGGGSGGSKAEGSSGFAGFERPSANASASGDMNFKTDRSIASTDIWHTGSKLNLFQIVSGKIEKVSIPLVK